MSASVSTATSRLHGVIETAAGMRRVRGVSDKDVVLLRGYSSSGDGGGGLFAWEHGVTTGDDGALFFVPPGALPTGRWRRIYDGNIQGAWFGCKPGLGALLPQQDNLAAALAATVAGNIGKVVDVLPGVYHFDELFKLNALDTTTYVEGLGLRCVAGRALAAVNDNVAGCALFRWVGAADATAMMRIRNCGAFTLEGVGFNGAGLASHCLQITHVLGDTGFPTVGRIVGAYFKNAKTANVLIGEASGTNYGDCCSIHFDNPYFQASDAGVTTTAHVRMRANATLGVHFNTPRFSSNETRYPRQALSMQTGHAVLTAPVFESQSDCCIFLDAAVGAELPTFTLVGGEAQSGNMFLRSATSGIAAINPTRSVVISGLMCDDIVQAITVVDPATNRLTQVGHGYAVNDGPFFVTSGGTLPAGLSATQRYWIQAVPTADTFTLSATQGGAVIDITDAGSGAHIIRCATSIYWDLTADTGLDLVGVHLEGDCEIADANSRVFAGPVYFTSVWGGFTGAGAARVSGTYFKSAVGNQGISWNHRMPDLANHASNAAAVSAGLSVGALYRTAGAVMVVI